MLPRSNGYIRFGRYTKFQLSFPGALCLRKKGGKLCLSSSTSWREKLKMDDHVMVICGDWICKPTGEWTFAMDKQRMSRVLPVTEGIGLEDLKTRVTNEFYGENRGNLTVTLSYWPPNSKELATGIKTPPVLLTNNGAIGFFFRHLRVNSSMNLFVSFEEMVIRAPEKGYVTPVCNQKQQSFDPSDSGKGGYVSTAGSKTYPFEVEDDDEELISEVEIIEEKMRKESQKAKVLNWSDEDEDAEEGYIDEDVDEIDVRPRGYHTEFWKPLIDAEYGGSDAVDVVFNADGKPDTTGVQRLYQSISNNIFDDWIIEGENTEPMGGFKTELPPFTGQGSSSRANNDPQPEGEGYMPAPPRSGGRSSMDRQKQSDVPPDPEGAKRRNSSGNQSPWMSRGGRRNMENQAGSSTGSGSCGRQPRQTPRKLQDIDDEEFDIPPLWDDTTYDCPDIPDLDVDNGDENIFVGKVFGNREDCQIALAIYAIKNQFHFKQTRTKVDYFVSECPDQRCEWRVRAKEMKGCGYYQITYAHLQHSCPIETRNGYKGKATSRVIASVFKAKFAHAGKDPTPGDLQQLVLEELRISPSYMKCYRAAEQATTDVRGTDDDSYLKLPEYLHMLKLANPGTVADLETDTDEYGIERFLYVFLAFGASRIGFRKLRHVVVLDGTHLGGKYKGVLLTASGQDANCQVYPLAYGVVDSENDDSWTWFLQKLERILADSKSLAIISDRSQSIATAIKRVYPLANHGACMVHLARNVSSRFGGGLAKLFVQAAKAYRVGDYKTFRDKIRDKSQPCADYLTKIGVAHWSRVYFPGQRYNIMTSNIAEQLNKALVKGRNSPIMELLIFIQTMMTKWFAARRKKSENHRGVVSIEVDKQMTANMKNMQGSRINSASSWAYEIVGLFGEKHFVTIKDKRCTCKEYDRVKIPCGHAMLAADSVNLPYDSLVPDCYKTTTWRETYAEVIYPQGDPRDVEIPEEVSKIKLMPPLTKRPPGRPKTTRIPSTGEYPPSKKQKLGNNRCTRCRSGGHNRTSCKNPI